MSNFVIFVENISKSYRLGQICRGTLFRNLDIWSATIRVNKNLYPRIGQTNTRNLDGEIFFTLKDVRGHVILEETFGILGLLWYLIQLLLTAITLTVIFSNTTHPHTLPIKITKTFSFRFSIENSI